MYVKISARKPSAITAIRKTGELAEYNFLNRDYYEAVTYWDAGLHWFVNYNKQHKALLTSGDAFSRWPYFIMAMHTSSAKMKKYGKTLRSLAK